VQLETAGTAGISVRIGEELANLIDDGATGAWAARRKPSA
jgi:hypothetical protein